MGTTCMCVRFFFFYPQGAWLDKLLSSPRPKTDLENKTQGLPHTCVRLSVGNLGFVEREIDLTIFGRHVHQGIL